MARYLLAIILSGNLSVGFSNPPDSLETIRAFQRVTENLASSGFVSDHQFDLIKENGFSHVISLLPGDQHHEDSIVTSKGMSFTSIPVEFSKPTMKNLGNYIDDMSRHQDKKVFLHCQANMMASSFLFVYRVTQLGAEKKSAKSWLDSIWYPMNQWHQFIERGLEKYGVDPEYRFEPDFIKLLREEGLEAAEKELSRLRAVSADLPLAELDLQRLADEYAGDKKPDLAIQVYRFNTHLFPDSWKVHDKLGNILDAEGFDQEAKESYLRVTRLNPDNIWAKRMLGKLGIEKYAVYWAGKAIDPGFSQQLAGRYDLGNAALEFSIDDGNFTLQPSWGKKSLQLYADSPYSYFVHENNWMFIFDEQARDQVKFIMAARILTGKKVK